MTDYKPGTVAMVTALNRREPYRAFFDGDTWRDMACHAFCVNTPTSLRPLMVLDLGEQPEKYGVDLMDVALNQLPVGDSRAISVHAVATQITEQTKPPRIPEPGLLGVVEGWQVGEYRETDLSAFYLREAMEGDADWTRTSDGKKFEWDDITEPILVREGVQS